MWKRHLARPPPRSRVLLLISKTQNSSYFFIFISGLASLLLVLDPPCFADAARIKLDQRNILTQALLKKGSNEEDGGEADDSELRTSGQEKAEAGGSEHLPSPNKAAEASGSEPLSTTSLPAAEEVGKGLQKANGGEPGIPKNASGEGERPQQHEKPFTGLEPQLSAERFRVSSQSHSRSSHAQDKSLEQQQEHASLADRQEKTEEQEEEGKQTEEEQKSNKQAASSTSQLGAEPLCEPTRASSVCQQHFEIGGVLGEVSADSLRSLLSSTKTVAEEVWSFLALPESCSCELLCRRAVQSLANAPPDPGRGCERQGESNIDCTIDLSDGSVMAQLRPSVVGLEPHPSSGTEEAAAATTAATPATTKATAVATIQEAAAPEALADATNTPVSSLQLHRSHSSNIDSSNHTKNNDSSNITTNNNNDSSSNNNNKSSSDSKRVADEASILLEDGEATLVVNYTSDALIRRILNMFGIFPLADQEVSQSFLEEISRNEAASDDDADDEIHAEEGKSGIFSNSRTEIGGSFQASGGAHAGGDLDLGSESDDDGEEHGVAARVELPSEREDELEQHAEGGEEVEVAEAGAKYPSSRVTSLLQLEKTAMGLRSYGDLSWGRRRRARRRRRTRRRRTRRRRTRRRQAPPAPVQRAAPTPPPCDDNNDYRDPMFKDNCKGWERFSCEGHPFSEKLKQACPRSCRVCCKDSETYKDPDFGEPCQYWRLRRCRSQRFAGELIAACPVACNACGGALMTVSAPVLPRRTSPAVAKVSTMLPTIRAAVLMAVSKLNLESARPILEKWFGASAWTDPNSKGQLRGLLNGVAAAMERVTFAVGLLCSESTLLYATPLGRENCGQADLQNGDVLCATSDKNEYVVYTCEPAASVEASALLPVLVHEVSKFPPASTSDVDLNGASTRGRDGAAALALQNPALAVKNGDNLAFLVQDMTTVA